ncbi:DUF11 domain-containing protein [Erysipelothrix sp. D19-032]
MYTLKFTNVGNETINNGIIRDVLPNEVELVENGIRITKPDSTVVQDITDIDGKKWSIEGLKTDETVEIHIPVTVKPLLEVGTRTIENTNLMVNSKMIRKRDQRIRLFIIKIYRTMSSKTVLLYREVTLMEIKKSNTELMFITQEVSQLKRSSYRCYSNTYKICCGKHHRFS